MRVRQVRDASCRFGNRCCRANESGEKDGSGWKNIVNLSNMCIRGLAISRRVVAKHCLLSRSVASGPVPLILDLSLDCVIDF